MTIVHAFILCVPSEVMCGNIVKGRDKVFRLVGGAVAPLLDYLPHQKTFLLTNLAYL